MRRRSCVDGAVNWKLRILDEASSCHRAGKSNVKFIRFGRRLGYLFGAGLTAADPGPVINSVTGLQFLIQPDDFTPKAIS